MSTVRRLIGGALWTYGAQLAIVAFQLAYAATTSRLVSPQDFGAYAVGLAVSALFSLVATGGLSQTVSRLTDSELRQIPGLWTLASLFAGTAVTAAYIGAPALAAAWGTPGSAAVIRVLAISVFVSPIIALGGGIMRREGQFRALAVGTLLTSLAGMMVGLVAVTQSRDAASLAVATVTSQLMLAFFILIAVRRCFRFGALTSIGSAGSFSLRLLPISITQYVTGNLTKFGTAHALPTSAIGQWNRAEVLTTVLFQQIQSALIPVLYPEFRHDREERARTRAAWTDMLTVVAWITVPLGLCAATILPFLLPAVLGDAWQSAAFYAIPLAVAGGIQPATVALTVAIEALGEFRVIWLVSGLQLLAQAILMWTTISTQSIWPALCGLMTSLIISHGILTVFAATRRLIDGPRLLRSYGWLVVLSMSTAGLLGILAYGLTAAAAAPVVGAVGGLTALLGIAIAYRERIPPIAIIKRRFAVANRSGMPI